MAESGKIILSDWTLHPSPIIGGGEQLFCLLQLLGQELLLLLSLSLYLSQLGQPLWGMGGREAGKSYKSIHKAISLFLFPRKRTEKEPIRFASLIHTQQVQKMGHIGTIL